MLSGLVFLLHHLSYSIVLYSIHVYEICSVSPYSDMKKLKSHMSKLFNLTRPTKMLRKNCSKWGVNNWRLVMDEWGRTLLNTNLCTCGLACLHVSHRPVFSEKACEWGYYDTTHLCTCMHTHTHTHTHTRTHPCTHTCTHTHHVHTHHTTHTHHTHTHCTCTHTPHT